MVVYCYGDSIRVLSPIILLYPLNLLVYNMLLYNNNVNNNNLIIKLYKI